MATTFKTGTPGKWWGGEKHTLTEEEQLRHDRWIAVATVVGMAVLIALLAWLASFGGGASQFSDPWPMMP